MANSEALVLEPFEKYMLWDDSPSAPMTPVVDVEFSNDLSPDILADAFGATIGSHELLCSRVVQRGGQLEWEPVAKADQPRLAIVENAETEMRQIDLMHQCGLRAWLYPTRAGFCLRIQWHHACCDGVGIRAFLVDLLFAYHARTGGVVTKRGRNLLPELLAGRGDFSGVRRREPISALQRLRNAYYFHFQLPDPLRPPLPGQGREAARTETSNSADFPVHADISHEDSQSIILRCKEEQISISSLASALLFVQCKEWNARVSSIRPQGRLRLLLPYDLRSSSHLRMPAANRMSFAFVGRKYRDTDDLARLVDGIEAEMEQTKRTQLPLDFLAGLSAASRSPWAMRRMLSSHNCMATTVLTYTGDIARGLARGFTVDDSGLSIGNCKLLRIGAAPPARLNTNVAIGLCQNWGRLCFSASYWAEQFRREDCERFLAEYVGRWNAWLQNTPL
ncbi:MAG: hypothetical protein Aurels2KO_20720 [Aureliella sp.]